MMPKAVPKYLHAWSVYPDEVRVSFENGKTIRYEIIVDQPEPVLGKMLNQFEHKFLGYKYKRKKRGDRKDGKRD
jgi:hypothetical protein